MSKIEYLLIWKSSTDFFGGTMTHVYHFKSFEKAKEYRRKWSGHSNGRIYKAELIEE